MNIVIAFTVGILVFVFLLSWNIQLKKTQKPKATPSDKKDKDITVQIVTIGFVIILVVAALISWDFITQQRWLPFVGERCFNWIKIEKERIHGFVSPCSSALHISQARTRLYSSMMISSGDIIIVKAKGEIKATPNLSLTGYHTSCWPKSLESYVNGPFQPEGSAISAREADNCLPDNRLFPIPEAPFMALIFRDGEYSEWQLVPFYKKEGQWLIARIIKQKGTLSFGLNMGLYQKKGADCAGIQTPYRPNEWGCRQERYLYEYVGGVEIEITKEG